MNKEKLNNYVKIINKIKSQYDGYWLDRLNKVSSTLEFMKDNEEFINHIEKYTYLIASNLWTFENDTFEYLTGKRALDILTTRELLDLQSLRKRVTKLNRLYSKYTIRLVRKSGVKYNWIRDLLQNSCGYSYEDSYEDEYFVFDNVDNVKKTLKYLTKYITSHYDLPSYYLIVRRDLWKVAKFLESHDRKSGVIDGIWLYTDEYVD